MQGYRDSRYRFSTNAAVEEAIRVIECNAQLLPQDTHGRVTYRQLKSPA